MVILLVQRMIDAVRVALHGFTLLSKGFQAYDLTKQHLRSIDLLVIQCTFAIMHTTITIWFHADKATGLQHSPHYVLYLLFKYSTTCMLSLC